MKQQILDALGVIGQSLEQIKENTIEIASDIDDVLSRLEDALNDDGLTREDAEEILASLGTLSEKAAENAALTREAADKVPTPGDGDE